MWSGFCGDLIRKTNQRLLILVLVGAAAFIAFFAYNRAYFRGFYGRPSTPSVSTLLAAPSASSFPNAILNVNGQGSQATSLIERTKDDSHPEGYISARYVVTTVGGKSLLVRVSPDDARALPFDAAAAIAERTGPVAFTGRVKPLTPAMSAHIAGDPAYLPYILDSYDYKAMGWVSSVIGGLVLVLVLWGARTYLQHSSNPAQDNLARGLAHYGPLETIVPQVDADMASAHTTLNRGANSVHIGQRWLAVSTPLRAHGTRLDGLVWVYRLVVKKKMYFVIPAGTRHTLMVYDRFGQKLAVQLNEAKVTEAIQLLRNLAPQAIYGYDKRLVNLWKAGGRARDRSGFLTEAQALLDGAVMPEAVTRNQYTGA